jgi:23S rRNA pseudouridine2605 synthase
MPEPIRLNKYLAHTLGISRREADMRIEQGRVAINGIAAHLGNIVHPSRDKITVDTSDVVAKPKRYTYLLLNKPVGYVCSRKRQDSSPTIYQLLPRQYHHLKVAGRLDKDSCGLVLLTDDGDTIYNLTHPKFSKAKKYIVGLNKPVKPADMSQLEKGVRLEDGISKLSVSAIENSRWPNRYKITMFEGRNRQIRRTFKHLGYSVTHLERTELGSYRLDQIANTYKEVPLVR